MATCSSCSAPLVADTNKCSYCGTRNDVDLKDKHAYAIIRNETSLFCPNCEKPLQTINLGDKDILLIERCANCFGLFFDSGKIEALLEKSVGHVFEINRKQLDNINQDRFPANKEIKYVKCPVCRSLMNRNAFGYRSGVVVDSCKKHGIWLDSGEITHLMEWKKAGGQLLHQQQKLSENMNSPARRSEEKGHIEQTGYSGITIEGELLDTVVTLIEKLFE
jgi:Zn-finger nucleic acid-binding protein